MVIKTSVGCIDDQISTCPQPQTEVHIIEGHGETLIETARLLIDRLPEHETSRSYCAVIADQMRKGKISLILDGEIFMRMPGHAAHSQDNTSMLNRTVGVEELGTHGANLLPL